jgi:hypothetical protein
MVRAFRPGKRKGGRRQVAGGNNREVRCCSNVSKLDSTLKEEECVQEEERPIKRCIVKTTKKEGMKLLSIYFRFF